MEGKLETICKKYTDFKVLEWFIFDSDFSNKKKSIKYSGSLDIKSLGVPGKCVYPDEVKKKSREPTASVTVVNQNEIPSEDSIVLKFKEIMKKLKVSREDAIKCGFDINWLHYDIDTYTQNEDNLIISGRIFDINEQDVTELHGICCVINEKKNVAIAAGWKYPHVSVEIIDMITAKFNNLI